MPTHVQASQHWRLVFLLVAVAFSALVKHKLVTTTAAQCMCECNLRQFGFIGHSTAQNVKIT